MRISDWSSDVCSSDLADRCRYRLAPLVGNLRPRDEGRVRDPGRHRPQHRRCAAGDVEPQGTSGTAERRHIQRHRVRLLPQGPQVLLRSEEHTSELQSLMRNSYAVFCLNKKNYKIRQQLDHLRARNESDETMERLNEPTITETT